MLFASIKVENYKSLKEVEVKIGISGDDGLVKILSGLNEEDEVVTFVKNGK